MIIEQFYDKGLAHASYAILSEGKMALVDPARDPSIYYEFAKKHEAEIVAVFETHPHADFVSSHVEIAAETGATVYVSKLLGAEYDHTGFDEGDSIALGELTLKAVNTPGHSPDSICIIAVDSEGNDHAVFTGDTLFVGDVGRPDLRESAGAIVAAREDLARDMYRSTRTKLMTLNDDVLVYPAHGPGSLCGKNMSPDLFSTIGREVKENYALQDMSEDEFVSILVADQPFVPKYFEYDVTTNKRGAEPVSAAIKAVTLLPVGSNLEPGVLVVDARKESDFKKGHNAGAINIQNGGKFETWLGSIVGPDEPFYLVAASEDELHVLIAKASKIGYEASIKAAVVNPSGMVETSRAFDRDAFDTDYNAFTIVDVRNPGEVASRTVFEGALNIPLPELRERAGEIPAGKPVVIHCAAGYRSAAGQSIVEAAMPDTEVLDLGMAIKEY